jgi:hypothetical protein
MRGRGVFFNIFDPLKINLKKGLDIRISSEIDCTKCANCCKKVQPVLDQEDIKKCCEGLGISVSQFKKKSLKPDEEQGKFVFNV